MADNIPLSPSYGKDVMGINFNWKNNFDSVMLAVEMIKLVLKPFDFRVHWGTYFGNIQSEYLNKIYGKELDSLEELLDSYKPKDQQIWVNKFMNCFADRLLYERHNDNYNLCSYTHKFEAQYEKIFENKS